MKKDTLHIYVFVVVSITWSLFLENTLALLTHSSKYNQYLAHPLSEKLPPAVDQ